MMDALTAYSYVRMALPAGARIRTDVAPTGDLTFDVWSDDGTFWGEPVIGALRCRCTLAEWWSSTEIEGQVDHVGTVGLQAGRGGVRVLAHAMARTWQKAIEERPARLARMSDRGHVLLGHPRDVHELERAAKATRTAYMLSGYIEPGKAMQLDTTGFNLVPPFNSIDPRGLYGRTGLI